MSITEKIREFDENRNKEIRKAMNSEKEESKREKAIKSVFYKYEKRALNYCNNMARSLGIHEAVDVLGKKIGNSKLGEYVPPHYFNYPDCFGSRRYDIGKKFQIFDRQTGNQVIGVDVRHQMIEHSAVYNATVEEIKNIYSKEEIKDFSIFYSFYSDEVINTPVRRGGSIDIPDKFEIEIVDLGNNRFDLKNTSSDRKEYNFEKNNVSREELREISDTILANMYSYTQKDLVGRILPNKTIFKIIKGETFGAGKS